MLSIIIPTRDEKELIKNSITKIFRNLKNLRIDAEIIVIDDSKDGTNLILKELSKINKTLKIIHRENSNGVGSAIRLGIQNATGNFGLIFMADAPDDIKYIPSILKKLNEGYDLVCTSRFMKNSRIIGYPPIKTITNRMCNSFVRIAFLRFDIKDFSSLFKGFNMETIKKLHLESDGFDIGIEIALKSVRKKYKIIEVPVSWKEREAGKSKLKLSKQARLFMTRIFKIFFSYW